MYEHGVNVNLAQLSTERTKLNFLK